MDHQDYSDVGLPDYGGSVAVEERPDEQRPVETRVETKPQSRNSDPPADPGRTCRSRDRGRPPAPRW